MLMNTNAFIDDAVNEYYMNEYMINSLVYDIIYEGDMAINDSDSDSDSQTPSDKTGIILKLKDKVIKLIKTLQGIIERAMEKVHNMIIRILQTDKGFKDKAIGAIRNNKPSDGVKLITYNYNDQYLETELNKLTKILLKIISEVKTSFRAESNKEEEQLLDKKSDDVIREILKQMGCNDKIDNMNIYFLELKKNFRNGKTEKVFVAPQTQKYYNMALGGERLKTLVEKRKAILLQQVNTVKTDLGGITENRTISKEVKQRALKQYSNLTHIYNFYCSFINIYVSFKTEEMLSYRIVLKRLYHF